MNGDKLVHIAFCADENVAVGLAVTLHGILANLRDGWSAEVFVLDFGLRPDPKRRLSKLTRKRERARIQFLSNINMDIIAKGPVSDHFTVSCYGRLLLADMLNVNRVIYLDCDILVRADLVELWCVDMEGKQIGGVVDVIWGKMKNICPWAINEMNDPEDTMFCSGVMLMDLERIRKTGTLGKCLQYIHKYRGKIKYADQEVINVALCGQYFKLSQKWDFIISWWRDLPPEQLPLELRKQGFKKAALYHLTGSFKPWNGGVRHPAWIPFVCDLYHSSYMRLVDWIMISVVLILPPRLQRATGMLRLPSRLSRGAV